MKTVLLSLMIACSIQAETISLAWNPNPTSENVTDYCLLYGNTPPAIVNGLYEYESFVMSKTTSVSVEVSSTEVTYFVVVSFNGAWSLPSYTAKYTPNRKISNTSSIEVNPQSGQLEFKYTVSWDSGREIKVQKSSDLTSWVDWNTFILEGVHERTFWVPLTETKAFFRSSLNN